MPARFSRRPQRRAFSRFRKRGLRTMQDVRRWEVGYFHNTIAHGTVVGGTVNTVAISLAQIMDHLADNSTVAGNLESYKLKAIEIGGLVFASNTFLNQSPVPGVSSHANAFHALFIDRLSPGGAPTSIPNLSVNTTPVIAATAVQNFETAFPTRILWRDHRMFACGANDVGLPHPQTYYAGSRSLRVRSRLFDDFGLFFVSSILTAAGLATTNWTTVLNGTIYWRASYR